MINSREKLRAVYYGSYKLGFRKALDMSVLIYATYIHCEGVTVTNSKVNEQTTTADINFSEIKNVGIYEIAGQRCLVITYRFAKAVMTDKGVSLCFFNLDKPEECEARIKGILKDQEDLARRHWERQRELMAKQRQDEIDAQEFFKKCYEFHISENTPKFDLFQDTNKAVVVYVGEDKSLNFLKIDGYTKDEEVGVIPYENIHYYEKAGDVHYVSETSGTYSSFGGSLTGASFSKRAALLHGILFGAIGMATAALMSYKPAEQKPSETHFDISSETKRIDERNVLLNFYSDSRKQYVDIELPQEIYNFLQTHLPRKKLAIVDELEKHAAIQETIKAQPALEAPQEQPKLPQPDAKLSLETLKEKVEKLKFMHEAGLLSDEEFNEEKAKLLTMI